MQPHISIASYELQLSDGGLKGTHLVHPYSTSTSYIRTIYVGFFSTSDIYLLFLAVHTENMCMQITVEP